MLKTDSDKIEGLQQQVNALTNTVNELMEKLNKHSHKFVTEHSGFLGLSTIGESFTGPPVDLSDKSWADILAALLHSNSTSKEDLVSAWTNLPNKSVVLDSIVLLDGSSEQLTVTFINNIPVESWKTYMTETFQKSLKRALIRQNLMTEDQIKNGTTNEQNA